MKEYHSPMKVMRMLTDSEYQDYISHDCQQYAAQGRTFNYNKMDMINKKYSEPKLNGELETAKSQPDADVANTTDVKADAAISNNAASDLQPSHADLNSEAHDLSKMSDSNLDDHTELNQNEFDNNTTIAQVTPPAMNSNERMNKPIQKQQQQQQPPQQQQLLQQEKKPFKCVRCSKNFTTAYSMKRHIGTVHDNNWTSPYKSKNKNNKSVLLPLPVPMPVATSSPRKRNFKVFENDMNDFSDTEEPPIKSQKFKGKRRINPEEDEYDTI